MSQREIRVTNLDAFRMWIGTESLDLGWMLTRLKGETEPSEQMKAGTAMHKALEEACEIECHTYAAADYSFDFNCECQIVLPTIREVEFRKDYGELAVVGHADGQIGNMIVDYKTTEQFDPERYMESYQWRYYLDMSGCDQFLYQIFVIRPFGPPRCYEVRETHTIKHYRYPGLHSDCERLALSCFHTLGEYLPERAKEFAVL